MSTEPFSVSAKMEVSCGWSLDRTDFRFCRRRGCFMRLKPGLHQLSAMVCSTSIRTKWVHAWYVTICVKKKSKPFWVSDLTVSCVRANPVGSGHSVSKIALRLLVFPPLYQPNNFLTCLTPLPSPKPALALPTKSKQRTSWSLICVVFPAWRITS